MKVEPEKLNKFSQSKLLKGAICGIAAFIIILLAFGAGAVIGSRKADFSHRWSDNYHRNFAGPREGFMKGFGNRDFMDAHGIFGQIIKIDGSTLAISSRDNAEMIVLVDDKTVIRSLRETIKAGDLKVDDNIVVIGEPNSSGQIQAKLIRVMPPAPANPLAKPAPKS